jgi:DNA-binding XRE family transcriptional regulator
MRCRIRYWRQHRGMTQAVLAQAVGRARSTVAEYEVERKRIPHTILLTIARVLRVKIDDLFVQEPPEMAEGTTDPEARGDKT